MGEIQTLGRTKRDGRHLLTREEAESDIVVPNSVPACPTTRMAPTPSTYNKTIHIRISPELS